MLQDNQQRSPKNWETFNDYPKGVGHMSETGGFDNLTNTTYIAVMKILTASIEVKRIVNDSVKSFNKGDLDYCYVYLHKINNIVFYVGMGSHNRAITTKGRSIRWYETAILEKVVVEIVEHHLYRRTAISSEVKYIQQYKDTCINQQVFRDSKILCINRQGLIIKKYDRQTDVNRDGFAANCVGRCCTRLRGIHKNYYWMYEDDYEKHGLLHMNAKNHAKYIQQLSKDGIVIRELLTAKSFEEFGFNPNIIQQVCTGKKKTHLGYKFQYIK